MPISIISDANWNSTKFKESSENNYNANCNSTKLKESSNNNYNANFPSI